MSLFVASGFGSFSILWRQMHMEIGIRVRFRVWLRIGELQNEKLEENEKEGCVHCARVSVSLGSILIHN